MRQINIQAGDVVWVTQPINDLSRAGELAVHPIKDGNYRYPAQVVKVCPHHSFGYTTFVLRPATDPSLLFAGIS